MMSEVNASEHFPACIHRSVLAKLQGLTFELPQSELAYFCVGFAH